MTDLEPQSSLRAPGSQNIFNTTHHYHGPVNNIENASNAHFGANYGQIYQSTPQVGALQPVQDLPVESTPIPDASHTRNRRRSPPDSACLAGTRTKLIQEILDWIEDQRFTGRNHVLWLCGPVGCGKSAISQAVAEDLDQRGRLVGSFFFFRGSGDRSRILKLVLTLAYQMRDAIPETKAAIDKALESPLALRGVSPGQQFQRLICEPLQAAMGIASKKSTWRHRLGKIKHSKPVYLIVIDGLDECDDREDVATFINDMLTYFERNPSIRLRILIASRIEEHIRARIERAEVKILNLHHVYSSSDIETLARHMFKEAAEHNLVVRSYGKDWPAKDDFRELLRHANGSFVFVTMLLKYILDLDSEADDGLTPMERFALALKMDPGLDSLYTQTLQRARHIPHFEEVLWTIALLYEPLSISGLALYLDIPAPRVVNVLIPLQSIINVPGDDRTGLVTLFHTSLRDFLLDEQRSGTFSPTPLAKRRERLAFRILKLKLTQPLTEEDHNPAFRYARSHWRRHWFDAHGSQIKQLLDSLTAFAQQEIPRGDLPIHLPRIFLHLACYSKQSARPGRDYTLAEDKVELFDRNAEAMGTLLNAYRLTAHHGIRMDKPDSVVQQCLVMHFMRFMMCGEYVKFSPRQSSLYETKSYIMESWARHLTLAILDDEPDEDLSSFLHSRYLPAPDPGSQFEGCVGSEDFHYDLEAAVEAVNKKFPGSIPTSILEVEELELPHIYDLPMCYYDYKDDGLSMVDMLQIFCKLLLPQYPSYGMPGKRIFVHVHDGTVFKFSSLRSGDELYLYIRRYNLYHTDDLIG